MSFDPVEDKIVPKWLSVIWLIIKIILGAALILMLGWFTLRSCYQDGTGKMKAYMWTEAAVSASEKGELTVKRLNEYQDPSLSSLFFISRIYHTEEIGQLQFMLRYNTLSQEYKDMLEDNGEAEFVFELTDKNGTHFTRYSYITDSALMYNYFRVAFEDVRVDLYDMLYVNIYLVTDEGDTQVGSCIVYDREGGAQDHKVKGKAEVPAGLMHGEKVE